MHHAKCNLHSESMVCKTGGQGVLAGLQSFHIPKVSGYTGCVSRRTSAQVPGRNLASQLTQDPACHYHLTKRWWNKAREELPRLAQAQKVDSLISAADVFFSNMPPNACMEYLKHSWSQMLILVFVLFEETGYFLFPSCGGGLSSTLTEQSPCSPVLKLIHGWGERAHACSSYG